jgi:hypothetical protein
METRTCKHTGIAFKPRRSNQIFIDAKARSAFFNKKMKAIREEVEKTNKKLLKNYLILKAEIGDKREVVLNKQFLLGRGYSFDVFTCLIRYEDNIVGEVYDFRIEKIDVNDNLKISRK